MKSKKIETLCTSIIDWKQYDAPTSAGEANVVVAKLADWLKSASY